MDRIEYKDYPLPDGYAWVIQPHLVSAALCEQERRTSNRMKYRSYIAFNKDAETWTVEVWGGQNKLPGSLVPSRYIRQVGGCVECSVGHDVVGNG